MARPSRNVDRLLLAAGRDLFPDAGAARLSVRKVAAHAGVNLGMFHYHFRTKELFVRQLFAGAVRRDVRESRACRHLARAAEALRAALNVLARFARDNGRLLRRLCADAFSGEPLAAEFLRATCRVTSA